MSKSEWPPKSEVQFIERLGALCASLNLPELANNNYSVAFWTYSKLSITDFTERHKFWILIQCLKNVRFFMREKDNWSESAIPSSLVRVMVFCLVWIYSIYNWEEDKANLKGKDKGEK